MSNRPIALEVARAALANVGVTETGENRGVAVETYQRAAGIPPGSPWCAAFVRYRFEAAAEKLDRDLPDHFPDSGWVPAYVAWAKERGVWLPTAEARAAPLQVRPGDLARFGLSQKCGAPISASSLSRVPRMVFFPWRATPVAVPASIETVMVCGANGVGGPRSG